MFSIDDKFVFNPVDITITFSAKLEQVEEGWIQGTIKEFPGLITTGSSYEDTKEMLKDALRQYILALSTAGMPDSEPT